MAQPPPPIAIFDFFFHFSFFIIQESNDCNVYREKQHKYIISLKYTPNDKVLQYAWAVFCFGKWSQIKDVSPQELQHDLAIFCSGTTMKPKQWLKNTFPPTLLQPRACLISQGIRAGQALFSLSKMMPCWWRWSLKTGRDNGSNTNVEALNYCCRSLSFHCSFPPCTLTPVLYSWYGSCYLNRPSSIFSESPPF